MATALIVWYCNMTFSTKTIKYFSHTAFLILIASYLMISINYLKSMLKKQLLENLCWVQIFLFYTLRNMQMLNFPKGFTKKPKVRQQIWTQITR